MAKKRTKAELEASARKAVRTRKKNLADKEKEKKAKAAKRKRALAKNGKGKKKGNPDGDDRMLMPASEGMTLTDLGIGIVSAGGAIGVLSALQNSVPTVRKIVTVGERISPSTGMLLLGTGFALAAPMLTDNEDWIRRLQTIGAGVALVSGASWVAQKATPEISKIIASARKNGAATPAPATPSAPPANAGIAGLGAREGQFTRSGGMRAPQPAGTRAGMPRMNVANN